MTIRDEIYKLYNLHVTDNTDLADYFRVLEVSGKVTMKTLVDTAVICLKHIEELEKDGTNTPLQQP